MRRRTLTVLATAALALGVVGGAAGPAMAQQEEITVLACIVGGGLPLPTGEGESLVCVGGVHDGAPVKPPKPPQG